MTIKELVEILLARMYHQVTATDLRLIFTGILFGMSPEDDDVQLMTISCKEEASSTGANLDEIPPDLMAGLVADWLEANGYLDIRYDEIDPEQQWRLN